MRSVIDQDLTANPEHIGGFVRLIFHDCVGFSCNGCLNMNQDDNNGKYMHILLSLSILSISVSPFNLYGHQVIIVVL